MCLILHNILFTFIDEWNRDGDEKDEQDDAEDAFENIYAQNQEQGAREDDGESAERKKEFGYRII